MKRRKALDDLTCTSTRLYSGQLDVRIAILSLEPNDQVSDVRCGIAFDSHDLTMNLTNLNKEYRRELWRVTINESCEMLKKTRKI